MNFLDSNPLWHQVKIGDLIMQTFGTEKDKRYCKASGHGSNVHLESMAETLSFSGNKKVS
jgi:hypothetical protein